MYGKFRKRGWGAAGTEKNAISVPYTPREKKIGMLGTGGVALAYTLIGGAMIIFVEGLDAKIGGGLFVTAGIGTFWADGYSPIKMAKGALEEIYCL